jgi:hypothetical protein
MPAFSVVYYSTGQLHERLLRFCLRTLASVVADGEGEMLCVAWHAMNEPGVRDIVWRRHTPGLRNMYEQILAGLAEAASDRVALAEHDVLYPARYHAELLSTGAGLCYNTNFWRLNANGFFRCGNRLLSNYGGTREAVSAAIQNKLDDLRNAGRVEWAEPEGGATVSTSLPTVDIRHGGNYTGGRTAGAGGYQPSIPHWGDAARYLSLFADDR